MIFCHEGDRRDSGPGVGIPVVEPRWVELHAHTTRARATAKSSSEERDRPNRRQRVMRELQIVRMARSTA